MVYNIEKVAFAYVKQFSKFVDEKKLGREMEGLYDLFSYCLKMIHYIPACEEGFLIDMYASDCISYLKKTKGVPKKFKKLGVSSRISIVTMSVSCFVAVGVVSNLDRGVDVFNDKESF